jgi:hypothetical protein
MDWGRNVTDPLPIFPPARVGADDHEVEADWDDLEILSVDVSLLPCSGMKGKTDAISDNAHLSPASNDGDDEGKGGRRVDQPALDDHADKCVIERARGRGFDA